MIALACDHTGIELKKEMMKLLGWNGRISAQTRRFPAIIPYMATALRRRLRPASATAAS